MFGNLRGRVTSAHVIALIALFVSLGGSVYAASKISGTKIKKGSEPGNRLKNDTVTGKQVKESSLGAVPTATTATNATNATTLGGVASSGFQSRVMWALVDTSGNVLRQSGGVSAVKDAGAAFHVHFPASVQNAGIVASVTGSGFAGSPAGDGEVKVATCPGAANCSIAGFNPTDNDVSVATFINGANADAGFYVAAIP